MKPEELINWGELSRILSGSRSVVTRKRMPKKYEKQVKELLASVSKWYESLSNFLIMPKENSKKHKYRCEMQYFRAGQQEGGRIIPLTSETLEHLEKRQSYYLKGRIDPEQTLSVKVWENELIYPFVRWKLIQHDILSVEYKRTSKLKNK